MNRIRRFTRHIRRLFASLRGPVPLAESEQLRAELETRTHHRQTYPLTNACRANGLTESQRRRVFDEFDKLAPVIGMAEARRQCVDMASGYGARKHRADRPWSPSAA